MKESTFKYCEREFFKNKGQDLAKNLKISNKIYLNICKMKKKLSKRQF